MMLSIVGLGNLGYSLAKGLIRNAKFSNICGYDHNINAKDRIKSELPIFSFKSSTEEVIKCSDIILICIRTNQVEAFIKDNLHHFNTTKSLVFLSAGLKADRLNFLLKDIKVCYFRAISNVNTISGNGYTMILKNENKEQLKFVSHLFEKVGAVELVENENDLDVHSLVSGCTPALIALFYEYLLKSSTSIGINEEKAKDLLKSVFYQTVKTINKGDINANDLKYSVCTPAGIVASHLASLENDLEFKNKITNWLPSILRDLQNSGK